MNGDKEKVVGSIWEGRVQESECKEERGGLKRKRKKMGHE